MLSVFFIWKWAGIVCCCAKMRISKILPCIHRSGSSCQGIICFLLMAASKDKCLWGTFDQWMSTLLHRKHSNLTKNINLCPFWQTMFGADVHLMQQCLLDHQPLIFYDKTLHVVLDHALTGYVRRQMIYSQYKPTYLCFRHKIISMTCTIFIRISLSAKIINHTCSLIDRDFGCTFGSM